MAAVPPSPRRPARNQIEEWVNEIPQRLGQLRDRIIQRWKAKQSCSGGGENEFDAHPEYKSAREWRQTFSPKEGVNYSWVSEYAEECYNTLNATFASLDEKADSIIRHLTGGAGLFALGAIGLASQSNPGAWAALSALPALSAALWAVKLAISVRSPKATCSPPNVQGAVHYAEGFGEQAKSAFLGQWHECCESLAVVVSEKSRKLKSAYQWYLGALLLLLLPFIVGPVVRLCQPSTPGNAAPVVIPGSR